VYQKIIQNVVNITYFYLKAVLFLIKIIKFGVILVTKYLPSPVASGKLGYAYFQNHNKGKSLRSNALKQNDIFKVQ